MTVEGNGAHAPTYTIPTRVIGWEGEGGARVEILSDNTDLGFREEFKVSVQKPTMGRKVLDFDGLKKKGLRTKGLVLLRKAVLSDDHLEAKEVEILAPRDAEDNAFIFQRTAVSVFPPAKGSQVATRARVAILQDGIVTETFQRGLAHVATKLDQAGLFGHVGIIYAGHMKNGKYKELRFGGDEERTPEEITRLLVGTCPKDVINESRTSGTKRDRWVMIPFFEADIADSRSSKLSAQRLNVNYGSPRSPKWTPGLTVMRMERGEWRIADATPSDCSNKSSDVYSLMKAGQ